MTLNWEQCELTAVSFAKYTASKCRLIKNEETAVFLRANKHFPLQSTLSWTHRWKSRYQNVTENKEEQIKKRQSVDWLYESTNSANKWWSISYVLTSSEVLCKTKYKCETKGVKTGGARFHRHLWNKPSRNISIPCFIYSSLNSNRGLTRCQMRLRGECWPAQCSCQRGEEAEMLSIT